jgi:hypothetical protein
MSEGQRYRITWKHPRARRRQMAEGIYRGTRGDHYLLEVRDGRMVQIDRSYSVRWHSLLAAL